jgi:hypothetical protein
MSKRKAGTINPNQVKDFKKTKQKVGKQAVRPDNFTQTAFRSKALSLPSQATLLGDKQGVAVNQRNQTLAELLVQLKHYSGSSRKGTLSLVPVPMVKRAKCVRWVWSLGLGRVERRISSHPPRKVCTPADAYFGLRDLFALHPQALTDHLGQVLESVVEGMHAGPW